MTTQDPIEILLVEDSPSDAEFIRAALAQAKIRNRLHVVRDGETALAFLRREPPCEEGPRPDLILLDLSLPRMDGREVLAALKADPSLKTIPVVVLSSSQADRDIGAAYDLGANSFVTKPAALEQFEDVVRSIEDFWFEVVKLPPRPA